jgi:hypothetical protein
MSSLSLIEFKTAMELFKHMPAFEALDVLCSIFGSPQMTIFIPSTEIHIQYDSRQLVDLYEDYEIYCGMYASDYKVIYYGGPPGMLPKCQGSLLTMVVDRFLRSYICGHKTLVSNLLEYAHEQKWYNAPNHKSGPCKSLVGA